MDIPRRLVELHVFLVCMAAFSLMVLIPYPYLWQGLPGSGQAFTFALQHGGPLHIVAGAAAMLAVGVRYMGSRVAWTWFAVATTLALGMELLGTGTGWPFGNYSYTMGLGPKILDRVPFSIPLSWYYLSFSSYLLARHALSRVWPDAGFPAVIALSTWLLMAWDLVLDPAMAHADQKIAFWVWHERGAYLGMPLANLGGWLVTGAMIVVVSRLVLGKQPDIYHVPPVLPFTIYAANLAFGAALCIYVEEYLPVLLALVAGIAPASLAFRQDTRVS